MQEAVYSTDIYGHEAGNGKWLVYWAIVERTIDRFKGKRVIYKYTVREIQALTESKPNPDSNIHRKLFLANQKGSPKQTVFVNQDSAVKEANLYLKNRSSSNAVFIMHANELYNVYTEVDKIIKDNQNDTIR